MIRVLLTLALLALAAPASAQSTTRPTAIVVTTCGTAPSSAWATVGGIQPIVQDVNGNLCMGGSGAGGSITTTPLAILGFGTLAVTNASVLASTMTAGPNSAVWPTTPGMLYVLNDAASNGTLYVCPLGGTCSATVGLELVPGRSWGFYKPATTMTVFTPTTATAQFAF